MKTVKVKDIEIGQRYHISGDLQNGQYSDCTPCITHDEVTRVITRVTDTHIICECGRRFIKNQNLQITQN